LLTRSESHRELAGIGWQQTMELTHMLTKRLSVHAAGGTWVVRAGGAELGETTRALELLEGENAPVIFFPHEDLGMAFIEPSDSRSRSPHLGEATYWHIAAKSGLIRDAGWSYSAPPADAAAIAGHIAFDRGRVAVEQV
jgi:uncharacterized protein (DUF427 family)